MDKQYDGPNFVYNNNGIKMIIPFHPRIHHLVEKVNPNSWAAIFTVALYNIAYDGEDQIDEHELILCSIVGHDDLRADKTQVTNDIARYLTDTRDLLKTNYKAVVDQYVALALNIPSVKTTSLSGEYTIRKIIHYWLRTELSHLTLKSPHHTTWNELSSLFHSHGILLGQAWMEKFGLYETDKPEGYTVTEPMFVAGSDIEVVVLGNHDIPSFGDSNVSD